MGFARTALLLAGMTGLFMAVGWLIGGSGGMMVAFLVALATNAFAWWNSDRMALAAYGAREVDAARAPELVGMVRQLAEHAAIPMPRVYVIENDQPNAFATGRDPEHAAVAVTTGLMRILDRQELAGVIAHELAHVRHRDTLTMTVTATLAGAISMLANFAFFFAGRDSRDNPLGAVGAILLMILAPLAAMLVQMAISRSREYEADRMGAEICGRPLWLAGALEKLEAGSRAIVNVDAERHPATAHMFIVNPLNGGGVASLFATHPPIPERVRRLRQLAGVGEGTPRPWG